MKQLQSPFITFRMADKFKSSFKNEMSWDLTSTRNNRVASMQFNKLKDQGCRATLTVFDEVSMEIEAALDMLGTEAGAWRLSYGDMSDPKNRSKEYLMTMTGYTPDFRPTGSSVTIELVSTGSENIKPQTKSYKGLDIHEIVVQLAEEEGWNLGTIEKCKTLYEVSAEQAGKQDKKYFYRWDKPALSFIKEDLIPYAVSAVDGSSNYIVTIDSSGSKPTINFFPIRYGASAKAESRKFQFNLYGDRHTDIISFRPKFTGLEIAANGGGTVSANTVDALTNEKLQISIDARNAGGSFAGKWTDVDPSVVRSLQIASASQASMEAFTKYIWAKNTTMAYDADLEIFGDVTLDINQSITVLAFNKRGVLHHSSGDYRVSEIVDAISGGLFTSTLSLCRNSAPRGKFYIGD